MRSVLFGVVLLVLGSTALAEDVSAEKQPSKREPQVIILKLDDVVAPVSPRWQRVTDYLEKSGLKASYGIIGYSLEQDNQAYFNWIKALHAKGNVEFWNHGYRKREASDETGEFEGTFEEQKAALERTQKLAKEKLGIELKTFGPHWSGTNDATTKAMAAVPGITMWFYGPKDSDKFVFERVLTLENPTFVTDFDKFRAIYERSAKDKPCLALQGHPNAWDEQRWEGFVKIIDYLKSKGCVFMTPSEYLDRAKAKGAKS